MFLLIFENFIGENKSLNHKNQEIFKVSILYFEDFKKGLFMILSFLNFASFKKQINRDRLET
jgi:hypothetical protein